MTGGVGGVVGPCPGQKDARPAESLATGYLSYQGAGANRADGPDIVRERLGCSGRSLVPRAQLIAQLAGNFLDRGQGRGTVQATL